jgi:serine/threonine-protein kinase HipA
VADLNIGLDVYLSGNLVGALSPVGDGYSFSYLPELIGDESAAPLSRSLPLRAEPYGPVETAAYIEGLLPQGEQRWTLAAELGVNVNDGYALIAELGRDCPGAVVFVHEEEEVEEPAPGSLSWLAEEELEQLLLEPQRGLIDPTHRRRMRFALPGERHKLALIRDTARGRWAWPEAGAPSTHILKPDDPETPAFPINAMTCMTALRSLGLPVAHAEVVSIAGRRCLVSKRFDRWGEGTGAERLHQESFCQAFGFAPGSEEGEDFDWRRSCELLREIGEEDAIESVFAVAFCDYLLGSPECIHGKRSALLYTSDGPMLAPFCDVHSVGVYESHATERSVYKLMRECELSGLAPSAIGHDPRLQSIVIDALKTIGGLKEAIEAAAERARPERGDDRILSRLLPSAMDSFSVFGDDLFDF